MLKSELLEKAKRAKSKEELMALAKENSISLADGEAEYYLALLNDPSIHGEVGDDELDDVSAGCKREYFGKKYVVVTSGLKCFNGHYESWENEYNPAAYADTKRGLWRDFSSDGCCGRCKYLGFTNGGTGFCTKS